MKRLQSSGPNTLAKGSGPHVLLSARSGSVSARGRNALAGTVSSTVSQQTTCLLKNIRNRTLKPGALTRVLRAAALGLIAMIRLRPRLLRSEVAQLKAAYDICGGIASISHFLMFSQSIGVQVEEDVVREVLGFHRYVDGHIMTLSHIMHVFERTKRDQISARMKGSSALDAFDSLGGDPTTGVVEVRHLTDSIKQFGLHVDLGKLTEDLTMSMSGGPRAVSVLSYEAFTDLVEPQRKNKNAAGLLSAQQQQQQQQLEGGDDMEASDSNNCWWTTVDEDEEDWLMDTKHRAWSPSRGQGFGDAEEVGGAAAARLRHAAVPARRTSTPPSLLPVPVAGLAVMPSSSSYSVRMMLDNDALLGSSISKGASFSRSCASPLLSLRSPQLDNKENQQQQLSFTFSRSTGLNNVVGGTADDASNSNVSSVEGTVGDHGGPVIGTTGPPLAGQEVSKPRARPSTAPGRAELPARSKAQRWKEFINRTVADGCRRSTARAASAASSRAPLPFAVLAVTEPCFCPPPAPGVNWRDDIKSAQVLAAKDATKGLLKPSFEVRPVSATSVYEEQAKKYKKSCVKKKEFGEQALAALRSPAVASTVTTAEELSYVPRGTELMGRWTTTTCNPRNSLCL